MQHDPQAIMENQIEGKCKMKWKRGLHRGVQGTLSCENPHNSLSENPRSLSLSRILLFIGHAAVPQNATSVKQNVEYGVYNMGI